MNHKKRKKQFLLRRGPAPEPPGFIASCQSRREERELNYKSENQENHVEG